MSGGKGGSKSSKAELPKWLTKFANRNIETGEAASKIGYLPWTGPDVAAMTPMQEQAMRNTGGAAQSFGLAGADFDPMAGMPEAEEFAGGVKGYSSMPMFQEGVNNLYDIAPGSMEAYDSLFAQNVSDEFKGKAAYYDPNNEDMVRNREWYLAEDANRNGVDGPQFPPGYEWLEEMMNNTGGGRSNWLSGSTQRLNDLQARERPSGGLPPWLYGQ